MRVIAAGRLGLTACSPLALANKSFQVRAGGSSVSTQPMEFLILGSLEVRNERGSVALGGVKPRAVMAVLLLHANEPVSAERLALALWGEEAPSNAVKTVQVHISRLRKALGDAGVIATTPAGYRLRVRPGELDAGRFELLVEEGRRALAAGQVNHAATVLGEALSLWRGPPLEDVAYEPFAQTEIARLEEQRLAALETRVEADLSAGRHGELLGELQRLVATYPTRERLAGQLMVALYRCGRQAEALEAYNDARRVLVTEVGLEPGPDLHRLQEAILRHDPSLELQQPAAELPRELDAAAAPPLVGRDGELAWLRKRWERAGRGAGALVTVTGPRGSGKSRMAAELAAEAHRFGATVLYATGTGVAEGVFGALKRAREATRPTLLVVDDADQVGADVLAELDDLTHAHSSDRMLVLASGEDVGALDGITTDGSLTLDPLDAEAVRSIAVRYAPSEAAEDVPVDWLLDVTGGIARRVHEVAGRWAQEEAVRHVGAVAGRAAADREQLRSIQAELTDGVEELQEVRERTASRRWDAPVVCPFKGLASFDVDDAPYFFGREKLVAELVARLVGARLLGIVGPSGSGKSSVMRAGLLPELASGVLPGGETWKQVLIRPGEHPLHEWTDAVAEVDDGEPAVIAIDQFEETFTTCEDESERGAFISELAHATEDRHGRYVVVIALRADFYGRCAAYPELAGQLAANHVLVRSMQRDELRRAIELPARRVGLRVDTELADALVADVKDEPGALPLLSTALLELWQRRDGRRLRSSVYEQTGGVRGAVARLAEEAFGQLDGEQRVVARGVLMRLAGVGAAGGVERRRVALEELETEGNEDAARVIALLTDRRLLTTSSGSIELAHEALMREWPRLRDWIDADRDGLRIHRNLNAAAREWEELGRDDGALYRGARLSEASEWEQARQPRLNETERAFLAASEAARQRDRLTRRRRIALAFGSLTVALVAISILAVVSTVQGRKTASRELANRSAAVLAGDPGLARAIGLEAVSRHDTPEAENAVRQATLADRATAIVRASQLGLNRAGLSRDRSLLAAGGQDGLVRVVSLRRGRLVSTIKRSAPAPALDASFSPDAKHVAIVSADGEVAIADLAGRQRRVVLKLRSGAYAASVDYARDGRRLLVAVTDGTVRLVSVAGPRSTTLTEAPGVGVARFDPSGTRVLTAGRSGTARMFDLAGHPLQMFHHGVHIRDVCWSRDGRRIATAAEDGTVRIWDAQTGRMLRQLAVDLDPLYAVQFSADGRRVVAAGEDGVVRLADVRGGPVLAELKGHRGATYGAGFTADADQIYSTGADGTVRTWAPPKIATLPTVHEDAPFSPSFSPDRELVVAGSKSGGVRLWNPATGTLRQLARHGAYAAALYSANGAYILSWSVDGTVRLRDVRRGTASFVRAPKSTSALPPVIAAAIAPTGRRIAIAPEGQRAVLQAPEGGDRVTLPRHGQINWLAFSPDGEHLLTASDDGTARTWNAATGAAERVLKAGSAVLDARYSPLGERIAAGGADGIIRVWRLDGGDPLLLYGHDGPVTALAFNREGDRIVSGGQDGTVRIWDAAGGDPLVVLHRHKGSVNGVAFSPSGKEVVSGAADEIRVSACEVCGAFPRVLALAQTRPEVTLTAADRRRLGIGGG